MTVKSLARWDRVQWSAMPQMLVSWTSGAPTVYALEEYDDDGPGPRRAGLYVAGSFRAAGPVQSYNIARWDGQSWEALGDGFNSSVYCLCVFDDDGPGPRPPALFAGGSFSTAGSVPAESIARWDGQSWSGVTSISSSVRAMAVFDDDGPGPNPPSLFVTGYFSVAGQPASRIAKWRGVGHFWEPLGGGLTQGNLATYGLTLAVFDEDGDGPNPGGLYVGGNFNYAGGLYSPRIARWGCPLKPGGPCYADCDGDGVLTLADFGCFRARFATNDPRADCNGDGVLNLSDFGCFQTKFVLGCP
jgi:hypothetical protein